MGSGVFTQEGQAWKHSRDLLRPQFNSNREYSFEDIRRCVETMLSKVIPDTIVDLQPLFFQLTLDTTLFMLFGDTASKMQSVRADFGNAFNDAQEYLAYRTRVGDLHWLITGPSMWRACRTVHGFFDAAIKEALEGADEIKQRSSESKRYVFIDALIEQTRDPKVLRDQCLSLLLAGRDSTACCLTWTL